MDGEFWALFLDTDRYRAFVAELGPWAPAWGIAAMIIVSFLPLPAQTVAIANGAAFGRLFGFVLTWIGSMAAALIAFAIARFLGRPVIEKIMPQRMMRQFEALVETRGAPFLLLARLMPFIPYTVVNYGSGISPVKLSTFVWTSALGMIAPIFAFVSIGALMMEQPWLGWLSLIAVVAALALVAFYMRKRLFQNEIE